MSVILGSQIKFPFFGRIKSIFLRQGSSGPAKMAHDFTSLCYSLSLNAKVLSINIEMSHFVA
jgi:hypothetical protein